MNKETQTKRSRDQEAAETAIKQEAVTYDTAKRKGRRSGLKAGWLISIFTILIAVIGMGAMNGSGFQIVRHVITDAITGITAQVESNGALAVNIQDQHSRTGDIYFSQEIGVQSTLTAQPAIEDYDIDVSAAHGIIVGDQLVMYDSAADRLYIGNALVVATNNITLDTPINYAYATATTVIARSTKDMNVDGSVTRQIFSIAPPIDIELDITRVIFQMTCTDAVEFGKFGDIDGGLTRGIVFRVSNGINVNYFNAKLNDDLANLMYDVAFYEAAKVQGVNGLAGRLTYGGQSKHGVTIRLAEGDSLDVIIQDDLTDLLTFRMIGTFHEVTD